MRKIGLSAILAVVITLCSCTPQKETNINEFLKILSDGNTFSATAENFRITQCKNERYKYSYMYDESTLLCLYSDKDGVIVQCTVTSSINSPAMRSLCTEVTRSFTGKSIEESEKLVKSAFESPKEVDGYKLVFIDSRVGYTFLINLISDELNTNSQPTLKKHIEKEDVSRPTIGAETTSKSTT